VLATTRLSPWRGAPSVLRVELTPTKDLEDRASGTDATTRLGHRRDGQLRCRAAQDGLGPDDRWHRTGFAAYWRWKLSVVIKV